MKCTNCGREINEKARFCPECGFEVPKQCSVPIKIKCPRCGSLSEAGSSFCNNCGSSIYQSEKKTFNAGLIFTIILLAAMLLAACGFLGYTVYQKNIAKGDQTFTNESTPAPTESNDSKNNSNENTDESTVNDSEIDPPEDEDYSEDYIFPSDMVNVTVADLYGKSQKEVALMRNEIYARHGYIFKTEPYKSYFNSKYWYVPNENFNENMLSELEKRNKDFIAEYEKNKGWR